jgi:hypothetical protein
LPDSASVFINESTARSLKKVLDEVAGDIKEQTEGMEPEPAQELAETIIENALISSNIELETELDPEMEINGPFSDSDGVPDDSSFFGDVSDTSDPFLDTESHRSGFETVDELMVGEEGGIPRLEPWGEQPQFQPGETPETDTLIAALDDGDDLMLGLQALADFPNDARSIAAIASAMPIDRANDVRFLLPAARNTILRIAKNWPLTEFGS